VPKEKLKIPPTPTTPPKTAKFINEDSLGYTPKSAVFRIDFGKAHKADEEEPKLKDPPPLYAKHAPEGGISGWATVAAAYVM